MSHIRALPRAGLPPTRGARPDALDAAWREIEDLQERIRRLSATLALVLDDHAHREAELERDLTDALAGVAWEIRVLSRALKAVVEGRPVPDAAPPAA